MEGMPLRSLIQQAWNLYSRDMIVDAPKFIDSDRYGINAEAPTYVEVAFGRHVLAKFA